MHCVKKMLFSVSILSFLSLVQVTDASAYTLIGSKYSTAPLNQKYFNDCGTYVYNGSPTSFYNAVQTGVSSWNNTQNTKVYLTQTTTQSESIMDFHNLDLGNSSLMGQTTFWIGSSKVDPRTTSWAWTKVNINPNGTWTNVPSGAVYTSVDGKATNVAAHEEGHALGLDHVSTYVLMYSTTASYMYYGINTPQADEVSGIQALYGKLQ